VSEALTFDDICLIFLFSMTSECSYSSLARATGSLVECLISSPSQQGLDGKALALTCETASIRSPGSCEMLIRKGYSARTLYVVLTGRCPVVNKGMTIAATGPGEPIGELAIAGSRSAAGVVQMYHSKVLELNPQGCDAPVVMHAKLGEMILSAGTARMAAVTARALGASGSRDVLVVRNADAHPLRATLTIGSTDNLIMAGPLDRPVALRPDGIEGCARGAACGPILRLGLRRERANHPIHGPPIRLAEHNRALHHHLAWNRPTDFDRLVRFYCEQAPRLAQSETSLGRRCRGDPGCAGRAVAHRRLDPEGSRIRASNRRSHAWN